MDLLTMISPIFGGATAILTGLIAYFGKIWLERYKEELKNNGDQLKTFLEHTISANRQQIEKELEIYQKIWAELVPLRNYSNLLFPETRDFVNSGPIKNEVSEDLEKILEKFKIHYKELKKTVLEFEPFYPKEIFDVLCVLINDLYYHVSFYEKYGAIEKSTSIKVLNEGEVPFEFRVKNTNKLCSAEKLMEQTDFLCNLIRNRIHPQTTLNNTLTTSSTRISQTERVR
jgi:hypothetical protein